MRGQKRGFVAARLSHLERRLDQQILRQQDGSIGERV